MSKFQEMGTEIGHLTQEKNAAYGDSFAKSGDILRILFPDGIQPEQYQDALAIVRVVDKLFRIATKKDAFGESPWRDIAGYGVLGAVQAKRPVKLYAEATVYVDGQKLEEVAALEFKVGDWVRTTSNYQLRDAPVEGVVTAVHGPEAPNPIVVDAGGVVRCFKRDELALLPRIPRNLEFGIGDRVVVREQGYWDEREGKVVRIDPYCTESLPYMVEFEDGDLIWFSEEALEKVT